MQKHRKLGYIILGVRDIPREEDGDRWEWGMGMNEEGASKHAVTGRRALPQSVQDPQAIEHGWSEREGRP